MSFLCARGKAQFLKTGLRGSVFQPFNHAHLGGPWPRSLLSCPRPLGAGLGPWTGPGRAGGNWKAPLFPHALGSQERSKQSPPALGVGNCCPQGQAGMPWGRGRPCHMRQAPGSPARPPALRPIVARPSSSFSF